MGCLNVGVTLVVSTPRAGILLSDGRLPAWPIGEDESASVVARSLFKDLLGFDPAGWNVLRQVGFVDDAGPDRTVLYAVDLPEAVPAMWNGAVWSTVDEVNKAGGETLDLCKLAFNLKG